MLFIYYHFMKRKNFPDNLIVVSFNNVALSQKKIYVSQNQDKDCYHLRCLSVDVLLKL